MRIGLLMLGLGLALAATPASASGLTLVGTSTKVCQLTGELDWKTGAPTDSKTWSTSALDAVDLGFPVDSAPGPLWLMFGDAWPPHHPPGSAADTPPDDAMGATKRAAPPDPKTCLSMQLINSAPVLYADPTVVPAVQQGFFNVPTGGVFVDKTFYGFFWIHHCVLPQILAPNALTPLVTPAPNPPNCLETANSNSVGRSVIAEATPADPVLFHRIPGGPAILPSPLVTMPSGFVYVSAAQPPPFTAPDITVIEPAIPVYGVPRYRASVPYLALAPQATFANPNTWKFFAGYSGTTPHFVDRAAWESGVSPSGDWMPPPGAEVLSAVPVTERCIGEHSVTYNKPLGAWLMLYNCGPWQIEARTALHPWGPWSDPTVLLSLAHDPWIVCNLIMSVFGCGAQRDFWPGLYNPKTKKHEPGFFYAPYVLDRYSHGVAPPPGASKAARIYWTLSTWNPYEVVIMTSDVAL